MYHMNCYRNRWKYVTNQSNKIAPPILWNSMICE